MKELARLIERFERWTGLDLQRGSSYSALERYLRLQLPADDPTALARYVDDLTTPHHPEALRLVDAITVCHTSFYRDPDQLAAVTAVLRLEPTRQANVWIPACATGEDPYSIALIAENLGRPVSILGTDINTRALAHATAGIYGPWSVRDLPPSMALPRRADGRFEVPARLRSVVSFARHNLMDVPPTARGGAWDVIICRNVLMYFTHERVLEVLQRLGAALRPGGYLFVGANDIFERAPAPLRFVRIGQRHVLWRPPDPTPGSPSVQTPPAGVLIVAPGMVAQAAGAQAGAEALAPVSAPAPASGIAPVASPTPTPGSTRAPTNPPAIGAKSASSSGALPALRPSTPTIPPAATAAPPRAVTIPPPMSSTRAPTTQTFPPRAPAAPVGPAAPAPLAFPAVPASSATPPTGVPASSATPPTGVPARPSLIKPSPARAHALLLSGNNAGALELVLEVLEADPLCVEARLIAGIAYQLAGDPQQALDALRAALVLAPDLWPAEMYLGFALLQLGEEATARRALRRGAQLAVTADRLPLSPSVATWFEGWRVDAIELGNQSAGRPRAPGG